MEIVIGSAVVFFILSLLSNRKYNHFAKSILLMLGILYILMAIVLVIMIIELNATEEFWMPIGLITLSFLFFYVRKK